MLKDLSIIVNLFLCFVCLDCIAFNDQMVLWNPSLFIRLLWRNKIENLVKYLVSYNYSYFNWFSELYDNYRVEVCYATTLHCNSSDNVVDIGHLTAGQTGYCHQGDININSVSLITWKNRFTIRDSIFRRVRLTSF